MIIADDAQNSRLLSDDIARIGCRSITVTHPLEAITSLEQSTPEIGVVLVPTRADGFKAREFLAFMRNEYPHVRRVGYSTHSSKANRDLVELRLICPTTLSRLGVALRTSGGQPSRRPRTDSRTDSRTARQLLDAWAKSDRSAFDELARRYRPSIFEGLISSSYTAEDAEDIAQETLLALFLSRPVRHEHRSVDALVADLTTAAALGKEKSRTRRARLTAKLKRSSHTHRAAREACQQPDDRLKAAELSAQVDVAINELPGWCRRPFWLRVVKGQSAKNISADLGMVPSTVTTCVRYARGLIANQIV